MAITFHGDWKEGMRAYEKWYRCIVILKLWNEVSLLSLTGRNRISFTVSSNDMTITFKCNCGEVDGIEALSFKSMMRLRRYLVVSLVTGSLGIYFGITRLQIWDQCSRNKISHMQYMYSWFWLTQYNCFSFAISHNAYTVVHIGSNCNWNENAWALTHLPRPVL